MIRMSQAQASEQKSRTDDHSVFCQQRTNLASGNDPRFYITDCVCLQIIRRIPSAPIQCPCASWSMSIRVVCWCPGILHSPSQRILLTYGGRPLIIHGKFSTVNGQVNDQACFVCGFSDSCPILIVELWIQRRMGRICSRYS